jgi:hypothetical protein
MRRNCFVAGCLFLLSCFCCSQLSAQGWNGPWSPNGVTGPTAPKGIYSFFLLDDIVRQAQTAANSSSYPDPATDAILVEYFTTLLDNSASSGSNLACRLTLRAWTPRSKLGRCRSKALITGCFSAGVRRPAQSRCV